MGPSPPSSPSSASGASSATQASTEHAQQPQQPSGTNATDDAARPAAAFASFFRPRVLSLGSRAAATTHSSSSNARARATGTPAPAPAPPQAPPPAKCAATKSMLWRRHDWGSYKHYYCRRKASADGEPGAAATGADARLSLLKEEWFRGKRYLDIGTNTGKVAWEIYQHYGPARVVGVDICPELVAAAQEKLAWACRRDKVDHGRAVAFRCEDFTSSAGATQGHHQQQEEEEEEETGKEEGGEQYDVITCLSVTKHVHLQGGDAALLALFRRVHRLLAPGGRFLLEPQPWKTYRKRKHVSAESQRHYSTVKLRPPFDEVLLGPEVGFASMEALGVPAGAPEGYKRAIYCFVQGSGSSSEAANGEAKGGEGAVS